MKLIKLRQFLDEFFYLFFTQIALLTITGIDWVMHSVLYRYGLQFSLAWAIPYWYLLSILFWAVAFVGVSAYYIDREKADKLEGIVIFSTLIIEYHGGILDSIWFLIERILTGQWGRAFENWSWSPLSHIFGYWDLNINLILNIVAIIGLAILWYLANRRE